MPTDYTDRRYVDSYVRARGLAPTAANEWVRCLSDRVPAAEVDVVLDIAAGSGRFWPIFNAAWSPRLVVAMDRSLVMLQQATDAPGVARVVGDIDALPFRPATADVLFCSMAVHYGRSPANCVEAMARLVRPGGWLLVRTGTHGTLKSFDFLRCFPTALSAEERAMPSASTLHGWFATDDIEVLSVEELALGEPRSRLSALASVLRRGFPSLQMVPRHEMVVGLLRYAIHLAANWLCRIPRPAERSVLITARRRP